MVKKFSIVSLGCPKNLTDAEEISSLMSSSGYRLSMDERVEIAVINTCAFLKSAVKESEGVIEEYINLKKKGLIKKIIVTGCLVERARWEILEKYPEIDAVVGISSLGMLKEALSGQSFILGHEKKLFTSSRLLLTKKHSVYLKISDGCDNRCAYCAIPSIRGPLRSKPAESVIQEAAALAERGAVEISLIAQDLTAYGRDIYGRPMLGELLKKLSRIKKIKWFRLMYVYPDLLDRELLEIIKDSGNICHYLEMPLQHISDHILERMNRRSREKTIREKISLARKIIPDIAIRSTFIVGFPGESRRDFSRLLSFVKEAEFENLAVFKYSREKGTAAWNMGETVPASLKNERYKNILNAQSAVVDRRNMTLLGREASILADSQFSGRTYADAPEIDGRIETDFNMKSGEFYRVKITGAEGYIRKAVTAEKSAHKCNR